MLDRTRIGLAVFMGAALMVSLATRGHAGDLRFEHVMNIGAEGRGAGQFKYVEDFAFSTYGSPIFKAVPKKRCKALYRALKKSPKSPELAVGAGSEPS